MGVHSCEALFVQGGDGRTWHEFHTKQRLTFQKRRELAEEDERVGTASNRLVTVGWAASKYRICLPLNPRTKGGWYDGPVSYNSYMDFVLNYTLLPMYSRSQKPPLRIEKMSRKGQGLSALRR